MLTLKYPLNIIALLGQVALLGHAYSDMSFNSLE